MHIVNEIETMNCFFFNVIEGKTVEGFNFTFASRDGRKCKGDFRPTVPLDGSDCYLIFVLLLKRVAFLEFIIYKRKPNKLASSKLR